jgi:hypothetical protein
MMRRLVTAATLLFAVSTPALAVGISPDPVAPLAPFDIQVGPTFGLRAQLLPTAGGRFIVAGAEGGVVVRTPWSVSTGVIAVYDLRGAGYWWAIGARGTWVAPLVAGLQAGVAASWLASLPVPGSGDAIDTLTLDAVVRYELRPVYFELAGGFLFAREWRGGLEIDSVGLQATLGVGIAF